MARRSTGHEPEFTPPLVRLNGQPGQEASWSVSSEAVVAELDGLVPRSLVFGFGEMSQKGTNGEAMSPSEDTGANLGVLVRSRVEAVQRYPEAAVPCCDDAGEGDPSSPWLAKEDAYERLFTKGQKAHPPLEARQVTWSQSRRSGGRCCDEASLADLASGFTARGQVNREAIGESLDTMRPFNRGDAERETGFISALGVQDVRTNQVDVSTSATSPLGLSCYNWCSEGDLAELDMQGAVEQHDHSLMLGRNAEGQAVEGQEYAESATACSRSLVQITLSECSSQSRKSSYVEQFVLEEAGSTELRIEGSVPPNSLGELLELLNFPEPLEHRYSKASLELRGGHGKDVVSAELSSFGSVMGSQGPATYIESVDQTSAIANFPPRTIHPHQLAALSSCQEHGYVDQASGDPANRNKPDGLMDRDLEPLGVKASKNTIPITAVPSVIRRPEVAQDSELAGGQELEQEPLGFITDIVDPIGDSQPIGFRHQLEILRSASLSIGSGPHNLPSCEPRVGHPIHVEPSESTSGEALSCSAVQSCVVGHSEGNGPSEPALNGDGDTIGTVNPSCTLEGSDGLALLAGSSISGECTLTDTLIELSGLSTQNGFQSQRGKGLRPLQQDCNCIGGSPTKGHSVCSYVGQGRSIIRSAAIRSFPAGASLEGSEQELFGISKDGEGTAPPTQAVARPQATVVQVRSGINFPLAACHRLVKCTPQHQQPRCVRSRTCNGSC